jgi:G3E family GTPase
VNFRGYEDKSYTAKIQAQYTDLIIMNKCELVSEDDYELVFDRVNDLNTDTPKVKFDQSVGLSADLVFGLETALFSGDTGDATHHYNEVDLIEIVVDNTPTPVTRTVFEELLNSLDKEDVFRVKGFVRLAEGLCILNWAFGRFTLEGVDERMGVGLRMTVMGVLDEGIGAVFAGRLGVERSCIQLIKRKNTRA